jgi:hypothetical protein
MEDYKLFNFNDEQKKTIIFINSTEDLYNLTSTIYNDLSRVYGTSFSVVVDLFLRNGFSFNRFVELNFDNGNYKLFIINPNEIPEVSKENIRKYLKNNINLLENSVLSKKAINFILNF